jgi:hypothetical protein
VATPSGVASNIVRVAATIDALVEFSQSAEWKYPSYHLNEKLCGGNSRYFESEKETGTTMKTGKIKKIRISNTSP